MARTETVTRILYQFDELSESAKETARNWWRNSGDCWSWASEWIASLQAFERIAPIKVRSWDVDRADISVEWVGPHYALRYDHSDAIGELSGVRAYKWLHNNGWLDLAKRNVDGDCTLTGYCGDYPLFDPIAQYAKNPARIPELSQLFYECAQSWVYAAREDMEYSYSDESIDENIRCNEYEFDESGNIA